MGAASDDQKINDAVEVDFTVHLSELALLKVFLEENRVGGNQQQQVVVFPLLQLFLELSVVPVNQIMLVRKWMIAIRSLHRLT